MLATEVIWPRCGIDSECNECSQVHQRYDNDHQRTHSLRNIGTVFSWLGTGRGYNPYKYEEQADQRLVLG
jgi:hypothetical protein